MAKTKKKVSMPASIRNRLLAAVSMLTVSSIMLVSTTYAWFTLSTAPEVKNISTTVAGNGSLEIALMPTTGLLGDIGTGFSATGNGGDVALVTANTTWGNIINLNDGNDSYGLSSVTLNPAVLNVTDDGKLNATNPLVIATYGYDGRIDTTEANTTLKNYVDKSFTGSGYGVRAIGEDADGALGSTYGYAVDLAFRMNATNNTDDASANGKLLLQSEGIQRIYNGSTKDTNSSNTETLGGGSYMSFNTNGTDLDDAKVKELMKAIRVTFVQDYGKAAAAGTDDTTTVSTNPVILGTARLDTDNITKGATETSAMLYLYDETNKAFLKDDAAVLINSMKKNAAVQVSAIVWLDGEMVTNASVSTVKSAFAQATLNLQFSTDVELKPANNNALFEGGAE